jgi:hypothetical protein
MNKPSSLTVIFSFLFFLCSCVNTKKLNVAWIYKNQVIYEGRSDSSGRYLVFKDHLIKPAVVKINKRDSIITIQLFEGDYQQDSFRRDLSRPIYHGLFFPYVDSLPLKGSVFAGGSKLRYLESSPVFQALTIPLKVRFGTSSQPYEAEPSINFGVALGWKFTHHVYENFYHRKSGAFVNSEDNHYSLTPGVFIGPSVVELNTQTSTVPSDRNVLSFAYGGILVFGINRLNIGLALGIDNAIGNNDKNWIYQGKPWLGATISFDFIQ